MMTGNDLQCLHIVLVSSRLYYKLHGSACPVSIQKHSRHETHTAEATSYTTSNKTSLISQPDACLED